MPIDAASDGDRERPGEPDRTASDLLVEGVAFGGRLAADEEEPVALPRLGQNGLFAGLLDPSGNLDRIGPRLRWTGLVTCFRALLHDSFGAFGLPSPLSERTGRLIVEVNDGRGDPPSAG